MRSIRILDEAGQFRIEIEGRFAGDSVIETERCWRSVLRESSSRSFVVDISQLSGYDSAGLVLLREMQRHGTLIAARNARALAFLSEISTAEEAKPTLVYTTSTEPAKEARRKRTATVVPLQRPAAAGQ